MSIEEIPVIDISCQSLTESAASSLLRACNEFGFFFIRNHGLSKELYQKLISGADQLFSSPEETKQKLTMGASSYTPRFVVSPFFESFKVSGPNFSASAAAQGFTQSLFGHQATEFSNCNAYLRINGFTPRSMNEEEEEEEELEVFKKHTDLSYVTIVFQNDIRGLQMRLKGGDWMDVRPRPSEDDNLMVNIGDFMEAWSNGRLRSAVHRVVLRKNNMKRFSMAFFLTTEDDDKEIYAPSEIVGEGKSRLYRPFSTQQYRLFKEKSGVNARYALKDIIGT
ncbi:gibberellin 20-oxidase-like protein isoform X2 [Cucurbita moschata]|uniref:Gibberellin 20-oxidase-like protein isoform X2 n=1 Tax=Cucurbita moschata TaxID=3662 RepID=A0A6J1GN12_CUCMO|nr:gibberellin 20-oxidase-like protein isoform X2 [Cucurbita moschata]